MKKNLANEQRHAGASAIPGRIRLWDLPVRIFHWTLTVVVTIAIISAELDDDLMEIHGKAGITIIGLVVFRLIWGIIGSTHARFANFVPGLSDIRSYMKGRWKNVGHNPIGALSVLALLLLLAAQAGTGLFANDDIDFTGPLANLVETTLSDQLTGIHHLLANFLLGLIALHIIAIGFYFFVKKDNLIKPMITGWKEVKPEMLPQATTPSGFRGSPAAFVIACLIALAVAGVVSGAARHTETVAAKVSACTFSVAQRSA